VYKFNSLCFETKSSISILRAKSQEPRAKSQEPNKQTKKRTNNQEVEKFTDVSTQTKIH
jgi:hypothetical protein